MDVFVKVFICICKSSRLTLIVKLPPRLTSFWIISSQISSDFLKIPQISSQIQTQRSYILVKFMTCICQISYIYLSKSWHVFDKVVNMYLSKRLYVFVKVVKCIFQSGWLSGRANVRSDRLGRTHHLFKQLLDRSLSSAQEKENSEDKTKIGSDDDNQSSLAQH